MTRWKMTPVVVGIVALLTALHVPPQALARGEAHEVGDRLGGPLLEELDVDVAQIGVQDGVELSFAGAVVLGGLVDFNELIAHGCLRLVSGSWSKA